MKNNHCRSVTQLCLAPYDPVNCSMPGFPVLPHLLELVQTQVHWFCDAIQPSHHLLSPSPPTFNLSQQQGLFKWISSSHHMTKNWRFSFNMSPSNDYSGLISSKMDWLDCDLLGNHNNLMKILLMLAQEWAKYIAEYKVESYY